MIVAMTIGYIPMALLGIELDTTGRVGVFS